MSVEMAGPVIGAFTKRVQSCYLDCIKAPPESAVEGEKQEDEWSKYVQAMTELGFRTTSTQIQQMHQVFLESRPHPLCTTGEKDFSWSEFCVLASELTGSVHYNQSCSYINKRYTTLVRERYQGNECRHEVFLGGSCNPTAWRKDKAIPILQREGVTYYNPQVDKWSPELVEIEEEAKQNASVLLFVIDNQTRAVSSMVETAYLIGRGHPIVVVIKDILNTYSKIAGETISQWEMSELIKGRALIKDLVVSHDILMNTTVEESIETVVKVIRQSLTAREFSENLSCSRRSIRGSQKNIMRQLRYMFSMYDNNKKNYLTSIEACLALCSMKVLPPPVPTSLSSLFPDIPIKWEKTGLSFEDFCVLYSELNHLTSTRNTRKWWTGITEYLWAPVQWLSSWIWASSTAPAPVNKFDLYLGGGNTTSWRRETAIPLLIKHGISYFNPEPHKDFAVTENAKRESSLLLFVITRDTPGVPALIEVAYAIGERREQGIVLCIEELNIDNTKNKLSTQALRDYSRARAYLTSIANKNRIPVLKDITEAVKACIHRLRPDHHHSIGIS